MKQETIDFKEEAPQGQTETPNITTLMNSTFLISGCEIKDGKAKRDGKAYKYAIIQTNMGPFRTASQVLVRQLGTMADAFKAGKQVRVKLILSGNAFVFASPTA